MQFIDFTRYIRLNMLSLIGSIQISLNHIKLTIKILPPLQIYLNIYGILTYCQIQKKRRKNRRTTSKVLTVSIN